MLDWIVIGGVAGLAFAYPAYERWLLHRTEPARERMLELARGMLSSVKYQDRQKDMISDLLDEALDRSFMVQMVARLPIVIWKLVTGRADERKDLVFDDEFKEFLQLHFRSASAANPFFGLLWRLEIAVFAGVFGLLLSLGAAMDTAGRVASKLSKQHDGNHQLLRDSA